MVLLRTDRPGSRKALSVRVSHRFTAGSARFDEDNLVSHAGLVPLLGLAEQTRLPQIIAEKVSITTARIKSGAANPVPKLLGVIAGMCAGADSIDDLDVLRAGGMPILFDSVYAPSTLGTLLRERSSTSLVEDVRPISRTNPSTCRKIKYSKRSDTPGSCPTSDHRWSATQSRVLAPHRRAAHGSDESRCPTDIKRTTGPTGTYLRLSIGTPGGARVPR